MWAFLVLTLALAVRASDSNNDTAVEEKLVIARGKLLVSTDKKNNSNFIWISCHDCKMLVILCKDEMRKC